MRVLFVCIGNSCRSQMAEGLARELGLDASSAGTNPATRVARHAVTVLAERGIDISAQHPKPVTGLDAADFDKVISMGCDVACSTIRIDADWGLEDPHGESIEEYRSTCDHIRRQLDDLIAEQA